MEGDSSDEDVGEEEEETAEHDQFCKVCKSGGNVILCDFCPSVYHLNCLNPPLADVPEGDWKCPRCEVGHQMLFFMPEASVLNPILCFTMSRFRNDH